MTPGGAAPRAERPAAGAGAGDRRAAGARGLRRPALGAGQAVPLPDRPGGHRRSVPPPSRLASRRARSMPPRWRQGLHAPPGQARLQRPSARRRGGIARPRARALGAGADPARPARRAASPPTASSTTWCGTSSEAWSRSVAAPAPPGWIGRGPGRAATVGAPAPPRPPRASFWSACSTGSTADDGDAAAGTGGLRQAQGASARTMP